MPNIDKLGVVFFVFIIIVLMVLIIFGRNGLIDYKQLKIKENETNQQTILIEDENRKLEKEIYDLKTSPDYIEHVAKHEHEMVAEDELIFKIKKKGEKEKE